MIDPRTLTPTSGWSDDGCPTGPGEASPQANPGRGRRGGRLAHLSIDVVVPAGSSVTLTAADALILWLAYQEAKALIGFDAPPNSPESPQAKCHSQQPTERLSQKQARVRLPP